jgi:hypothetical protein
MADKVTCSPLNRPRKSTPLSVADLKTVGLAKRHAHPSAERPARIDAGPSTTPTSAQLKPVRRGIDR